MNFLSKYLNKTEFANYKDFAANCRMKDVEDFNFGYDIVDEYARVSPDKRALVWCDNHGNEKIFTFEEMSKASNRVANMLLSLGLKRGDVVMTMLNRRYEYYLVNVACCKLGIIIIPATFMLTEKDISYRCNLAGVKMIISIDKDDILTHIKNSKNDCATLEKIMTISEVDGFLNFHELSDKAPETLNTGYRPALNDTMLIYFTSGTTGYPKMVAHSFKYPLGFIMNAAFWQDVVDDGLHFTMAETGWAKFSWGKIYGQWIAGSAVFCYEFLGRFTPTDVLPLISKYGINTFCAPPTIYRFLIKEDLSKYDFSSLTHCSTAGEPLNAAVAKAFHKATGLQIYEGFGQSESAVLLGTFKYCKPCYGSMGLPCTPIYDIVLLDGNGNEVGDNTVGEICVRLRENQFGLLIGYHGDTENTRRSLGGKYYGTGDLATRDAKGLYWFVGRKDDIIKSSGYRIGPFEVESALHEHPAVKECAITGVPDLEGERGQLVKATIVLAPGYSPSQELVKELQNYVKHATAPYKYPRVVEFVPELPKTISGKIMRKEIRKQDGNK